MGDFCTTNDIIALFRALTADELQRASSLIPIVSDSLRQEAKNVGKDLDQMLMDGELLPNVLKSVMVDIISRTLLTSTTSEPFSQTTESALGYSITGTYLNPGGGLFIKKAELARLGLKRQKVGVIDLWG